MQAQDACLPLQHSIAEIPSFPSLVPNDMQREGLTNYIRYQLYRLPGST